MPGLLHMSKGGLKLESVAPLKAKVIHLERVNPNRISPGL